MSYPEIFAKQVLKLYYQDGLKQKEISERLNCSISTIKRIIKASPQYEEVKKEKKQKKEEEQQKKKEEQQKKEEEERLWWGMIQQQRINSIMMSKKRRIYTAQAVEYSMSQYIIVKDKLVYADPHHKPNDLPKIYDIHNNILSQFKNYIDNIESEKWNSAVEKEALE